MIFRKMKKWIFRNIIFLSLQFFFQLQELIYIVDIRLVICQVRCLKSQLRNILYYVSILLRNTHMTSYDVMMTLRNIMNKKLLHKIFTWKASSWFIRWSNLEIISICSRFFSPPSWIKWIGRNVAILINSRAILFK